MKIVSGDFLKYGYAVVETFTGREQMKVLRDKFLSRYFSRFQSDPIRNRNIIKLFAEDIEVKRFFCMPYFDQIMNSYLFMLEPVQTGPIVTHYTANDFTGGNYGLPYHQDWPSMGTSTKGVIVWTSITESKSDSPGLSILPGSHLNGLQPGEQTTKGYVLDKQDFKSALDIEVNSGEILLMSPFLVHKTRMATEDGKWKLSLSCRFDDLSCPIWNKRNFVSAYRTIVDRDTYKT